MIVNDQAVDALLLIETCSDHKWHNDVLLVFCNFCV